MISLRRDDTPLLPSMGLDITLSDEVDNFLHF